MRALREIVLRLHHVRHFRLVGLNLCRFTRYALHQWWLNRYYARSIGVEAAGPNLCRVNMNGSWAIYYPAQAFRRESFLMLVREALDPGHWHQYAIPETPIKRDDVILDCGAAEGLWSYVNVERVRKIYLVEPQSTFCMAIQQTFSRYLSQGKAEIVPVALGEQAGQGFISDCGDIAGTVSENTGGTPITVTPIDGLPFASELTFIKIDVEGLEADVLRGARQTLQNHAPKLAVATYHKTNDWQEIRDIVLEANPAYHWKLKGLNRNGKPMMIHLWVN